MRKYYLDNIRWITLLLVVFYHVIYMYNGIVTEGVIGSADPGQLQDIVQYLLYPWFMTILFIVSGMCARYYLQNHSVGEFLRSRTQKLLVPSTVGLLLFGWIQGCYNMSISNAFASFPDSMPRLLLVLIMDLSGTGVLWFAQVLWILSALLCMVIRISGKGRHVRNGSDKTEYGKTERISIRDGKAGHDRTERIGIRDGKTGHGRTLMIPGILLLGILYYLSGLILNAPVIVVYRFGIYGLSFFAGYLVFSHDAVIEWLSKWVLPIGAACTFLGVQYVWRYFGENYTAAPAVNSVSACAYGWTACLFVLGFMKKYGDKTGRLHRFFTKRSFGIYVFHYLPLSATAYYLKQAGIGASAGSYLFIGAVSFF